MFFLSSWDIVSRVWKRTFLSMHCLLITPLTPSLFIYILYRLEGCYLMTVPDYFDGGLKILAFPSLG